MKALWKEWRALWATLFMGFAQRADEDTFYRVVNSTADVMQGRKSVQQMAADEFATLPPRVQARVKKRDRPWSGNAA